ncbi:unnamed protein product, partial [Effrenium voratum]
MLRAGVPPDFVECHGTGTALGDPIEVGALSRVLKYALLSSTKSCCGHAEAAAGALGLARLASCQQCTQHLQVLNPHISTNLQFLTEVARTPKAFAFGVSAFGFGGTNAHVVLRPHRSPRPLGTRPTFQRRPFLWQAAPDVLAGKLYGVQWRRQAAQPTLPAEQTVKAFLPDLPVELPSGVVQGSSCGEDSTHLLFLRALGAENASAASEELFELLDLARDCSQRRLRVSLLVVTQLSALSGLPGEGRRCNSAALWGLARSLRLEAPWVSVRLLDLEGPSQLGNISLGELGEGELEFGHLDAHFRVPRLAALQPEGRTPRRPPRFGWHLISGGTGGIGLLAALALPAEGLILLSRRGEIAVQEHALFEELESSGVKLQRIRADVADAEAVAAVMQQVSPLQGIVHAAQAPLGYVELARQSRDTFLKEFRVRGLGAWSLHRAERGVQSFVAITSLNAALGQGSNSAIAAANCLVEGLVVVRRSSGQAGAVLQFSRVAEVGSNAKRPLRYASAVSAIRELPMQLCAAFLKSFLVPPEPLLLADVQWPQLQAQLGQDLPILRDLAGAQQAAATGPVAPVQPQLAQGPVLVLGAGFGGLAAARRLQRLGLGCAVLEKAAVLGGSWTLGNRASKVQIQRGTYYLGYPEEPCPAELPNYSSRVEMLRHAQGFVDRHGLSQHIRLGAEVLQVQKEGSRYRARWRDDRGEGEEGIFGAVMAFPGFLPTPRRVQLPEEHCFQGVCGYGVADDVDVSNAKRVAILGHGAFAVEHARTSVE